MKYLTLVLLFTLSLTLSLFAQDKPKASPTPVKSTPEISLKLTPAETEEFGKIQQETSAIGNALNDALKELKGALTDKDVLAPAWKVSTIYGKLLDAQGRFQTWMTESQKAHGCGGCGLDPKTLTFVKPVEDKK